MGWEVNSSVQDGLGWVSTVAAVVLFLVPTKTFYGIIRKKSVGSFSSLPYGMTLCNCFTWFLYGLPVVTESRTQVWVTNGIGAILEFSYLVIFFIYCELKVALF
jgi:solute carrier family 50 protein (sugar transporter)